MKRVNFLASAGLLVAALAPTSASAAITDPLPINLTPSTSTQSGNIWKTADRPNGHFRFYYNNNQNSVMSLNVCSNYNNYVSDWYGAWDQNYHTLGSWITGTCLRLRGRTTTASSMAAFGYVLY